MSDYLQCSNCGESWTGVHNCKNHVTLSRVDIPSNKKKLLIVDKEGVIKDYKDYENRISKLQAENKELEEDYKILRATSITDYREMEEHLKKEIADLQAKNKELREDRDLWKLSESQCNEEYKKQSDENKLLKEELNEQGVTPEEIKELLNKE